MRLKIEFTRPKRWKPISCLIRMVTRAPYSHVRLRWINSVGVDIVYEASGSEVKFIGPAGQQYHPVVVEESFEFDLTKEQYRELVKICMQYSGIKYGTLQLVGMLLARLFRLDRNPLSSGSKAQVCSEVVGRVLEEVLDIDTGLNFDVAGPKELYNFLEKHNG